jgi:hypothetical protein
MADPATPFPDPAAVARWLSLEPEVLLKGCDQFPFQGPGPGGQKRNRVYSGVRLKHRESGLAAEASERREARRNLEDALHRLRMALALSLPPSPRAEGGAPTAADDAAPPELPAGLRFRADAGPRHPDYPRCAFLALLALDRCEGRVSEAAAALGTGASALARLLRADKAAWAKAQAVRQAHGRHPLKAG